MPSSVATSNIQAMKPKKSIAVMSRFFEMYPFNFTVDLQLFDRGVSWAHIFTLVSEYELCQFSTVRRPDRSAPITTSCYTRLVSFSVPFRYVLRVLQSTEMTHCHLSTCSPALARASFGDSNTGGGDDDPSHWPRDWITRRRFRLHLAATPAAASM
jgi:hypothetical protein